MSTTCTHWRTHTWLSRTSILPKTPLVKLKMRDEFLSERITYGRDPLYFAFISDFFKGFTLARLFVSTDCTRLSLSSQTQEAINVKERGSSVYLRLFFTLCLFLPSFLYGTLMECLLQLTAVLEYVKIFCIFIKKIT